jgi:3-oxoacyl-[acyl-carrier protein] reductase
MLANLHENIKKDILKTIPLKRFAEPEEIAELCSFLVSDKASYITGEVIKIDGGLAI